MAGGTSKMTKHAGPPGRGAVCLYEAGIGRYIRNVAPPAPGGRPTESTVQESTRRRFVTRALHSGLGLAAAGWLSDLTKSAIAQPPPGTFLGLLDFQAEPEIEFHTRQGDGLDVRLYTDLSDLDASSLTIDPAAFYIRTGAPDQLDLSARWTVAVHGDVVRPQELTAEELREHSSPRGEVLMECAGNARPFHFGLMSSAKWSGVELGEVLERSKPRSKWVLIEGF